MSISYHIVKKRLPVKDVVEMYDLAGWFKDKEERKTVPNLIRGSFCFIVAKYCNKIVGMGRVLSDGVSDAYILDIFVKTEYRKHGIGKKIVQQLIQYCEERQLPWISLVAAPKTTTFYKKLGFKPLKNHTPMSL